MTAQWALAELRSGSGTQFDPDVVDAFVAAFDALSDTRKPTFVKDDSSLTFEGPHAWSRPCRSR